MKAASGYRQQKAEKRGWTGPKLGPTGPTSCSSEPTPAPEAMRLERIAWTEPDAPADEALRRRLADEGFESFEWQDPPGADYAPHAHDHDESLWVVEGTIVFGVEGRDYALGPGDRLMLPAGTVHTARAGRAGARYLIGERR